MKLAIATCLVFLAGCSSGERGVVWGTIFGFVIGAALVRGIHR